MLRIPGEPVTDEAAVDYWSSIYGPKAQTMCFGADCHPETVVGAATHLMSQYENAPPVDIQVDNRVIATLHPGGCPIEDAERLREVLAQYAAPTF